MSENSLDKVEEGTFRGLEQLVNVALSGNKIEVVEKKAFDDLPVVRSISLARNEIREIQAGAFSRLPRLKNLFLQKNRLKEFTMDMFTFEGEEMNPNDKHDFSNSSTSDQEADGNQADESEVKDRVIHSLNQNSNVRSSPQEVMNINVSFNEISELASKQEQPSSSFKQEIITEGRRDESSSFSGGRDTTRNSFPSSSIESSSASSSPLSPSPSSSPSSSERPTLFPVGILDASHNHISRLGSLDFLCDQLHSLFLSYNKISQIFLESFQRCSRLESLALNNNFISSIECTSPSSSLCPPPSSLSSNSSTFSNLKNKILGENKGILEAREGKKKESESPRKRRASFGIQGEEASSFSTSENFLENLEILNLASNRIESLILLFPLLNKLSNLKILDLSSNRLQVIDSSSKLSSLLPSLEKLILSGNRLVSFDCYSLQSRALSVIDLSNNRLTSPPASGGCESLSTLVLSFNDIQDLKEASFFGLQNLKQLNVSGNRLQVLESKSFLPLTHLQELDMSNCSISFLPDFPLPRLLQLQVSRNLIHNTSSHFLSKCRKVKHLDLSHNSLPDVPRNLWRFVPGLIHLDISFNPIEVLDTTSLNNLLRLRHLDMTGLHLKYIDSRLLHSLK